MDKNDRGNSLLLNRDNNSIDNFVFWRVSWIFWSYLVLTFSRAKIKILMKKLLCQLIIMKDQLEELR